MITLDTVQVQCQVIVLRLTMIRVLHLIIQLPALQITTIQVLVLVTFPCTLVLVLVTFPCTQVLVLVTFPCTQVLVLVTFPCTLVLAPVNIALRPTFKHIQAQNRNPFQQ